MRPFYQLWWSHSERLSYVWAKETRLEGRAGTCLGRTFPSGSAVDRP